MNTTNKKTLAKVARAMREIDSALWKIAPADDAKARAARLLLFDILRTHGYALTEKYTLYYVGELR